MVGGSVGSGSRGVISSARQPLMQGNMLPSATANTVLSHGWAHQAQIPGRAEISQHRAGTRLGFSTIISD